METPTPLLDALRAKYQALQADFGDRAADRLREVLEHALEQVTGKAGAKGGRPRGATAKKSGGRTWTPAQREEQRKKMEVYWSSRRKDKGPRAKKARGSKKAAASEAAPEG